MKKLSTFIKDEFVKNEVDQFFNNSICIDTIEEANNAVFNISNGNYANIIFTNSVLKDRFIDKLLTYKSNVNIINCNCTVNSFFENNLNDGFLVFNNLKHCKHIEIIEEIKKHKKSILLC